LFGGTGCSTVRQSELWSADRAYKATLLQSRCGGAFGDETIFWKVRVDKPEPTASGGWFFVWDIENDRPFDADPPAMRWEGPRALRVDAATDRLRGELESHINDLVVVRTFSPAAHAAGLTYRLPQRYRESRERIARAAATAAGASRASLTGQNSLLCAAG
jgi:hypothetical protein